MTNPTITKSTFFIKKPSDDKAILGHYVNYAKIETQFIINLESGIKTWNSLIEKAQSQYNLLKSGKINHADVVDTITELKETLRRIRIGKTRLYNNTTHEISFHSIYTRYQPTLDRIIETLQEIQTKFENISNARYSMEKGPSA